MTTVHTIKWAWCPDGGFVAGDPATGRTSYAYPTSTHATLAKRMPAFVAETMVAGANRFQGCPSDIVAAYDARNWLAMGGA